MSPTIDEYKTIGLTLINTAERYIDTEPIQNEIASIGNAPTHTHTRNFFSLSIFSLDKSWSEYIEYILDTLDYIQLHQEDLREFEQISHELIHSFNDKHTEFDGMNDEQLTTLHNDLEKYYEQVEVLNQKGELLLQSSATNLNEDQANPIEQLLETINRNYDSLTTKAKVRLERSNNLQPAMTQSTISSPTTTITTTSEEVDAPILTEQLADEIRHHIDETNLAMNELSELLITSTTDTISAQPIKLSEQLLDNAAVQSELERRKIVLDQLHSNIETLKTIVPDSPEADSITGTFFNSSHRYFSEFDIF